MTKSKVTKAPNNPPTNGSKSHGRIEDIAARTSMTHWAVEEAVRNGDLPAIKPGKHYIISMVDADRWMEKLMQRDADNKSFNNIADLNAWLKRHGHPPIDPNAPRPTDKEAQAFFENCEKDEDGNIILLPEE